MQERYRPNPNQIKPVLAEAMRGVLPEHIRTRRDKRSFDELYYLGLNRNLSRLKRLVATSPVDALDILDKRVLIESIDEAALGAAGSFPLRRLNVTLSLMAWLAMEREWQRREIDWQHTFRVPLVRSRPESSIGSAQ